MGKYCPKDKAKGCNNTKIVKAIQKLLTEMQSDKNNGMSPISVNDLEKTIEWYENFSPLNPDLETS